MAGSIETRVARPAAGHPYARFIRALSLFTLVYVRTADRIFNIEYYGSGRAYPAWRLRAKPSTAGRVTLIAAGPDPANI